MARTDTDTSHSSSNGQAEEGTEADLICKTPEEKGNYHRAPQLCHDVKEAETPVSENSNGGCRLCSSRGEQPFTEGCAEIQG